MAREPSSKQSPDLIAGALRKDILSGRMKPGDRIVERDLGTRFGTSRGPAREALRLLQNDRLVSIDPYRGARVAEPTIDEILEMFEARAAVYGLVARLAVRRASTDVLAQACERIAALIPLIGLVHGDMQTTRTVMRLASETLNLLAESSRSDYVRHMFDECVQRTSWHISFFAVSRVSDPLRHEMAWRKLANGLSTRDPGLAGDGAREIAHATEADALHALSQLLPNREGR